VLIWLVTICAETDVIREKIEGRKERTRKRRNGSKQLQNGLQKKIKYLTFASPCIIIQFK